MSQGSIRPGVADRSAAHVDDTVAALLNPFNVMVEAVAGLARPAAPLDTDHLPDAAKIRRALGKGLCAGREHRPREGPAVTPWRCVGDGDVVGGQAGPRGRNAMGGVDFRPGRVAVAGGEQHRQPDAEAKSPCASADRIPRMGGQRLLSHFVGPP